MTPQSLCMHAKKMQWRKIVYDPQMLKGRNQDRVAFLSPRRSQVTVLDSGVFMGVDFDFQDTA